MHSCLRRVRTRFCLLVFALLSVSAHAEDRILSVVLENDSFLNSDRYYTQGSLLSFMWAPSENPGWLRSLGENLPAAKGRQNPLLRTELALGQNIFTPENTESPRPAPGDRPYAGWLYLNFGVVVEADRQKAGFEKAQDSLILSLGIVGPSARAEDVQSWWHRRRGYDEARGWDSQLHDELAVQTFFERSWRNEFLRLGAFSMQVVPHAGAALGNVYVYANTGATLRFGMIPDDDFGAPRVQPSLPGTSYFSRAQAAYLFVGVDGRLVARNIFLDGNTFDNEYSVDKRRAVGDLQAGGVLTIGKARLALTQVWRSSEFHGQSKRAAFTSLNLSTLF